MAAQPAARLPVRYVLDAWATPTLVQSFPSVREPGLNGKRSSVNVGSTLGGGSSVNAMQINLPPRGTYASWDVARFNERVAMRIFRQVREIMHVRQPPPDIEPDYANLFHEALARTGVPIVDPYPGNRDKNGTWINYLTMEENGRRVDACTGFITKANLKCKLEIIQDATVEKILLEKKCSRAAKTNSCAGTLKRSFRGARCARGVRYISGGRKKTLHAKYEVILSAGSIESPKLLQLSGIGPSFLLKKLRVKQEVDLPVGNFMQTRLVAGVKSTYSKVPLADVNNMSLVLSDEALKQFEAGRGGPLGVTPIFANTRFPNYGYGAGQIGWNTRGEEANKPFIIINCLSNPGRWTYSTVKAKSTDIMEPPEVFLNVFNSKVDVENMVKCVQGLRAGMKELKGVMGVEESLPKGLSSEMLDDDDVLGDYLRQVEGGATHFAGSCGVKRVVNRFLRVRGVLGLRVVDSSAIPYLTPNAGPYVSVMMLSKHAAETLVARQYQCLA